MILSLLVKYFWAQNTVDREHQDPINQIKKSLLQSVRNVHFYYEEFYKKPSEPEFEFRKSMPLAGEPNELVEKFLFEAEEKIARELASKDFTDESKNRTPADKTNRTIFTLHEHLRQKTHSPQWELFWNVLVAAEVISGGGKQSNKDRQIRPHLDSFQRDHPKEALAISKHLIPRFIYPVK